MRLSVVLVVVSVVALSGAYPGGAPEGTCTTLEPYHEGARRNPTKNPYNLTANAVNNRVIVSLSGPTFKGYIIQGFSPLNPQEVIGAFASTNNSISCFSQTNSPNTVTHSDPADKRELTFEWTPPTGYTGETIFRGTVVRNYGLFHSNLYSNRVTL